MPGTLGEVLKRYSAALIALAILASACSAPQEAGPTDLPTVEPTMAVAPTLTLAPTPEPTATVISSPTAEPMPTPKPTATPEPSWANGFQLGVHADDMAAHLPLINYAGIGWVAQHAWHFEGDQVALGNFVGEAHDVGLLAFVSVTGDWTRGYEPEYQAEFVRALAHLAAEGADAIEIWDQANSLTSMPVVDPVLYTDLLCEAHAAIKEANPATLVVSGPPAPSDSSDACSDAGCGDVQWLEALAADGAFECADFVGARYTTGATGPGTTVGHPSGLDHPSFYFLPVTSRYFEAAGGSTPLAFSQLGYLSGEGYAALPDAYWWAGGTTAAYQAGWIAEAVQIAAESPMVGMVMIWHLDATDWGGDYDSVRGGYALIRPDGSCLACELLGQAYHES